MPTTHVLTNAHGNVWYLTALQGHYGAVRDELARRRRNT
jgi:hypothetical protein